MDIAKALEIAMTLEQRHGCSREAAMIAAFHGALAEAVDRYLDTVAPRTAFQPETPPTPQPEAPQTPQPETPPTPIPAPDPTPEVFQVTLDELRRIVQAASKAGRKDGIKEILASYNAAKLPDLDPSTYSEVAEKVQALHVE